MSTLSNPAHEKAALLIAEGWKQIDVANELQVDPMTISRWKKRPEVYLRIRELVSDLTTQAVVMLRDNIVDNTQIILDIAAEGGEPGVVSSRLKAALWCVEAVMGKREDAATAEKTERRKQGLEAKLARYEEDELKELAERGE
jgi:hypothetical protein